ncbi:Lipopolysaccharide-modifying protein [Ostreococcus tauri]|uniref:Lipopolysaccharide-modifying protein n=1 Tax=Ostreococcus tauri TaxID=70448 RepID=A0A096PB88_OSTTA|nr:Lipopolysaccharide-modifying protein [Ostreococcus tauri]CEG01852.1 Lipopolysaccharide-modifying protein [Ostreococcus tauri]|eukprot:XP_003083405.2 Lipopolysaccharide-modifying protein [Ostreococcus tauri]
MRTTEDADRASESLLRPTTTSSSRVCRWRRVGGGLGALVVLFGAGAALAAAFGARDGDNVAAALAFDKSAPTTTTGDSHVNIRDEWGPGPLHEVHWDAKTGFHYDAHDGSSFEKFEEKLGARMIQSTVMKYYPTRLKSDQPSFSVYYTVEDYPKTKCWKSARTGLAPEGCHTDQWPRVYNFASQPKDASLLPALDQVTLITIAEPLVDMLEHEGEDAKLEPPNWPKQQVFGMNGENATAWENLIPKIAWQGTDYRFYGPEFDGFKEDSCHHPNDCVLNQIWQRAGGGHGKANYTLAMRETLARNDITPRLRLVLNSLLDNSWIDAKFFCVARYDSRFPLRVKLGKELRVEADRKMTGDDLAKYRYHIDLGGAGGTTWTGTIHKMSLPGVLFHHETAMRDSYFDSIKPWVHYIPVAEDLRDLRQKFDWAQANPQKCKQISAAASAWVKAFNTRRALLRHNYNTLAVNLAKTIDPSKKHLVPFEKAHPSAMLGRMRQRILNGLRRAARARAAAQ